MWGGSWFGGSSGAQQRKDAPKKAILDLRQQLDMLQKREKHLENQMVEQENIAKKNLQANNKTAAKTALKRKKVHENSLEQTSAQISMLENQIYSIESANINQETLLAMQNASNAMKKIRGNLTIDKVDKIMEEMADNNEVSKEIANAIANGPHAGEPIDEDELIEELETLEQEVLDAQMLNTGTVPVLPTGPVGEIKGKSRVGPEEEDDEAELRKLQAEMAM